MTKDEFQHLLKRYKEGNCSADEIRKINDWFMAIGDEGLELSNEEKEHVKDRIFSAIRPSIPSVAKVQNVRSLVFSMAKIAASLLIVMLVVYVFIGRNLITLSNQTASVHSSSDRIEYKNTTTGILKIQLPDSSLVELKPSAEIFYAKKWDAEKREVHLTGEAFFKVVKDAKRPFYVYGGEIVTKVLGTSFSVKAPKNAERIEVAVREGKVSVYEDARKTNSVTHGIEASGVILTPNEKVEYFVEDKHWVTSLVEEPRPLPAINKASEFVFSSTPVSEIVKSIERCYSIDIIIENEASYSCTFTGDVSMMELYDMLEVICKSTGANYEVKGTKILITGKGCQ